MLPPHSHHRANHPPRRRRTATTSDGNHQQQQHPVASTTTNTTTTGQSTTTTTANTTESVVSRPKKNKNTMNKQILTSGTKSGNSSRNSNSFPVDKKIVDELLLVCGVIGTVDSHTNELVPVHECLNWLQDLQRVLRRDDDLLRPISLLLGQWNVLPHKLLPLCCSSGRYDHPLLLTLCKILVILTKPLAEQTIRAGKMIVDPHFKKTKKTNDTDTTTTNNNNHHQTTESKNHDKVVHEQIRLRENAIQQANLLFDYKKAFCRAHHQHHHPSSLPHTGQEPPRGDSSGSSSSSSNGSLFSVLVSLLAEPLSRTSRRSEEDHLAIELVLHLFTNLVRAQPLFVTLGGGASSSSSSSSLAQALHDEQQQVHDELVTLLHQELVLDIVCVLAADLDQPDNAPYNLLVLELLHHLWKPYHPAAVARALSSSNHQRSSHNKNKTQATQRTSSSSSLLGQLQRERQRYAVPAHTRHSQFGGTLLQMKPKSNNNKTTSTTTSTTVANDAATTDTSTTTAAPSSSSHHYVSAAQFVQSHPAGGAGTTTSASSSANSHGGGGGAGSSLLSKAVFVPSGRHVKRLAAAAAGGDSSSLFLGGPSSQRAHVALHYFLQQFVQQGYGPMAKSLKGEFRRDSVRLHADDPHFFIHWIWFVSHWWRKQQQQPGAAPETGGGTSSRSSLLLLSSSTNTGSTKNACSIGSLIFTMDIFTMDLLFRSMDLYQQKRQYTELAMAVSMWMELVHLLQLLFHSNEQRPQSSAIRALDGGGNNKNNHDNDVSNDDENNTEQIMALGLLHRLFYNTSEPLDRLPWLFSQWEPGTTTREYVADLVELCHVQLKLLQDVSHTFQQQEQNGTQIEQKKRRSTKAAVLTEDATVQQMQEAARDFDLNSYIRKRLVSAPTVAMYIHLLGQFEHNTVTTNHRIVAFLKNRVSKQVLYVSQDDDDDDIEEYDSIKQQDHNRNNSSTTTTAGLLPRVTVTLQPLLYQYSLFTILDRILHLSGSLPKEDERHLVPWAANLVSDFCQATQRNPMLWIEALLLGPLSRRRRGGHANIARHCDQVSHVYVSEEFRMLLVKDRLQRQVLAGASSSSTSFRASRGPTDATDTSHSHHPLAGNEDDEDDDENEEMEFEDIMPPLQKANLIPSHPSLQNGSKRRRRAVLDDEDDQENENGDMSPSNSPARVTAVNSRSKRAKKRHILSDDDEEDDEDDHDTSDMKEDEEKDDTNETMIQDSTEHGSNDQRLDPSAMSPNQQPSGDPSMDASGTNNTERDDNCSKKDNTERDNNVSNQDIAETQDSDGSSGRPKSIHPTRSKVTQSTLGVVDDDDDRNRQVESYSSHGTQMRTKELECLPKAVLDHDDTSDDDDDDDHDDQSDTEPPEKEASKHPENTKSIEDEPSSPRTAVVNPSPLNATSPTTKATKTLLSDEQEQKHRRRITVSPVAPPATFPKPTGTFNKGQ